MEKSFEQAIDHPDVRTAIWDALDAVGKADTLDAACCSIAELVEKLGSKLLLVKFADLAGKHETVRPWSAFSENIKTLGKPLQEAGGCAFHRESLARMRPFLLSAVEQENYESLLERRFFSELGKLGYRDIFAIPVVMGRGMALTLIGLDQDLNTRGRQSTADMVGHVVAAMLVRFPQVGRLFEERRLTSMEADVLRLKSNGYGDDKILLRTGLSGLTQVHLLESARQKLGAANNFELVRIATLLGEIDPLGTGNRDPLDGDAG